MSDSNPGVSNPAGGPTVGSWPKTEETLPTGDEAAEGKGPKTEDNPTGEPADGAPAKDDGPDDKGNADDTEDEEETTP